MDWKILAKSLALGAGTTAATAGLGALLTGTKPKDAAIVGGIAGLGVVSAWLKTSPLQPPPISQEPPKP